MQARRGEEKLLSRRALKARVKATFASIPQIAFVEFDAVFTQKTAILLLKTAGAMVLFPLIHFDEVIFTVSTIAA